MFTMIMLSFSIIMVSLFLTHPVTLSITVLMKTLWYSLIIGTLNSNFWYSYIMVLIMIGGMLILFMYMTNVASNESFKQSKSITIIFILTMFMIPMSIFLNKFTYFIYPTSSKTNLEMSLTLAKFFNFPMNSLFIFIMVYLLLTMIMAVKISDIQKGPLRQMK